MAIIDFDAYKNNVIRHEVGHWVVARQLGYDVGEIKIHIESTNRCICHKAHAHINLHPSLKSIADIEKFLIDRISILWAGMMYQSTDDKRDIECIKKTDGVSDYSKLKELCFALRGIRFPEKNSREFELEQMKSIKDECWNKAKEIIETHHLACERLISELSQRITKKSF